MSDMYKDEIGVVAFADGTYDVYPDDAKIPPSVSYTRTDTIAAKDAAIRALAGALQQIEQNKEPDGLLLRVSLMKDIARQALKTHAKAIEEAGE